MDSNSPYANAILRQDFQSFVATYKQRCDSLGPNEAFEEIGYQLIQSIINSFASSSNHLATNGSQRQTTTFLYQSFSNMLQRNLDNQQCQYVVVKLFTRLSETLKSSQQVRQIMTNLINNQTKNVGIQIDNVLLILVTKALKQQISQQQLYQYKQSTDKNTISALQIYLTVYDNLPLQSDHPILMQFSKYGFNLSYSEPLLIKVFSSFQQLNHQFIAQFIQFLTETFDSVELRGQLISISTIASSLQVQLTDVKEQQASNWNIQLIFKTLKKCYSAFKFDIIESLNYINFTNSYFNPHEFVKVILNAQYGLNDGVRNCYCVKCAEQQKEFLLVQAVTDTNNKIPPSTRYNLLVGIILLLNHIINDMNKHIFCQLKQMLDTAFVPNSLIIAKYYLNQRYLFYLDFSFDSNDIFYNDDFFKDFKSCGYICPLRQLFDYIEICFKQNKVDQVKQCNQIQTQTVNRSSLDVLLSFFASPSAMSVVWRSVPVIQTLDYLHKYLSKYVELFIFMNSVDAENYKKMEVLKQCCYKDPLSTCPEQYVASVARLCSTTECSILSKACTAFCLGKYLNKQGKQINSKLLDFIIENSSELVSFTIYSIWHSQPQQTGRLLDVTQEMKSVQSCLLFSKNFFFSLDIATLAAGRQLLNLALYLNGQFMENGFLFVEICSVFVIKKICKFALTVNQDLDISKYSDFVTTEHSSLSLQQSLNDLLQLADFQSNIIYSEQQYKFVKLSDSVISESIIEIIYKFLQSQVQIIDLTCKNQLVKTKLLKLISLATECCSDNYPSCVDVQISLQEDELVKKDARTLVFKLLSKDLSLDKFVEDMEVRYKNSDVQKSQPRLVYMFVINILLECIQNHSFIYELFNLSMTSSDDVSRVAFHIMDIASVLGQMLADGLLNQDIFLPRILKIFFQSLFVDSFDKRSTAKHILLALCSKLQNFNKKQQDINFNDPEQWYFFFDIILQYKLLKQLLESQKGSFEFCVQMARKCNYPQDQLVSHFDENISKTRQVYSMLSSLDRVVRSPMFDEDIQKFLTQQSQMVIQIMPQKVFLFGNVQEFIKEKFNTYMNDKSNDVTIILNDNQFTSILEKDINQTAEFFIYFLLLEQTTQEGISKYFTFFVKWNNQEVFQIMYRYCILVITRLLFVPCNFLLSQEQLVLRRNRISNIGKWLSLMLFRNSIKGLDRKDIDFLCLIDLSKQSNTLPVVSNLIFSFILSTCNSTDYMPATCGFYLIVLQYLTSVFEELFNQDIISDTQDDINPIAYNRTLVKQDIQKAQKVMDQEFNDNDLQIGKVSNSVILQFPLNFLSDQNLALLQECSHYSQVPINLTFQFIYSNFELFQLFVITQQLQKSEPIFETALIRIMEQARDTSFNLLSRMVPSFNPEKDEKHREWLQKFMSKISCSTLRSQLLTPIADNILKQIYDIIDFENIPDITIELITNTIIRQLCFMASEAVIQNLQMQARQFAKMQLMQKKDANQLLKLDFEAQNDLNDTPYGEELSQPDQQDVQQKNSNLQNDIEKIIDAFSNQDQQHLQYNFIDQHRNVSIFPYVAIDPYFQIICEPRQIEVTKTCEKYQPFCKLLKQDIKTFIDDRTNDKASILKQAISGYVTNQQIVYEQVQNLLEGETLDQGLYKVFKNLLNQQNYIVQNSTSAHNLSLYNMAQSHKLNTALHALRQLCFQQQTNQVKLSFLEPLYKLAFSSLQCTYDSTISYQTFKPEFVQQTNGAFIMKLQPINASSLKQECKDNQNKMKELFLQSLKLSDNHKVVQLFEQSEQLSIHLTDVTHGYFGISSSFPLGIIATVLQIFQDLKFSQQENELKQYGLQILQQTIASSLVFDISSPSQSNYWIADCVYALLKGFVIFEMFSPQEIDSVVQQTFLATNQQFTMLAKQLSFQQDAFICNAATTTDALAKFLSEIFYDFGDSFVLKKVLKLNDFPYIINFVQEFYVQCHETQAIILNKTLPLNVKQFLMTAQFVPQWVSSYLLLIQTQIPVAYVGSRIVNHSFNLLFSNYIVGQGKVILDQVQTLEHQFTQYVDNFNHIQQSRFTENIFKSFINFCSQMQSLPIQAPRSVINAIIQSHVRLFQFFSGYQISDKEFAKFIDTLLFSVFQQQFHAYKTNEVIQQQQIFFIDCLARLLYFILEQTFENNYHTKSNRNMEKPQTLCLILHRIQLFLQIFSNMSISGLDKLSILKDYVNIDISNRNVKLSDIMVKDSDDSIVNFACQFIQRLLYTFQRDLLSPVDKQRQFFQSIYVECLCGLYFQIRPQVITNFALNYFVLISEPTLLKACLEVKFEDIQVKQNIIATKYQLLSAYYYQSSTPSKPQNKNWVAFHCVYQEILKFACSYVKFQPLKRNNPLSRYFWYTVRLSCMISHSYPEYIKFHRLSLLSIIPQTAIQLENAILSAQCQQDLPITDDVSGLLSLSQTNLQEMLVSKILNDNIRNVMKDITDILKPEVGKTVVQLFKQLIYLDPSTKIVDFDFIHSFLYYVMRHCIIQFMQKNIEISKIVGVQLLLQIFKDCTADIQTSLIIGMIHFISEPSVETYIFSQLIVYFGSTSTISISFMSTIKRMITERTNVKPTPWGLIIIEKALNKNNLKLK